jgi:hypothetical protein
MHEINIIYDNLSKADIPGLRAALGTIKHVRSITINKNESMVTLLSDKKIKENILMHAGEINGCTFRVIIDRRRI